MKGCGLPQGRAMLVDPILSSNHDLTGIADGIMGPSKKAHRLGDRGGGVSGNSQAPLLPPGVTSPPTPLLTLVNPSGSHTAPPTWSSPLKNAVVHAGGTSSGDASSHCPDFLLSACVFRSAI
jgi:hypothetical protein